MPLQFALETKKTKSLEKTGLEYHLDEMNGDGDDDDDNNYDDDYDDDDASSMMMMKIVK